MSRYVHKKFSPDEQDRFLEYFCEVLQKLKSVKEKKYFLKDLLNRGERLMIARRFKIAELLEKGTTYDEIAKSLQVSRGTIARVEKLLNFGRDGYKNAINKIKNKK